MVIDVQREGTWTEGREGGREGRCSDNLLLLSFMSKLWWVGRTSMLVVTAIWKPRLPPAAATTATETTTTKVHKHRIITDQAGRQFAGRVPTYPPSYLPTCCSYLLSTATYLPSVSYLPTPSVVLLPLPIL
jgi:hypothetical protein